MLLNVSAEDKKLAMFELENARLAHERYLLNKREEDCNQAEEGYINAVKYNPGLPEAYYRLALLMWDKGAIDIDTAIEQCERAIEYSPKSSDGYIYKGYFERIAENYEAAECEFQHAIKCSDIKSARPRLLLAMSLSDKMKKNTFNIADFIKFVYYSATGIALLPFDKTSFKVLCNGLKDDLIISVCKFTGHLFEKLHLYNQAYSIYNRASFNTTNSALFLSKMGDIKVNNKNFESAYLNYKQAHIQNPKDKVVLMKLATLTQTCFAEFTEEAIDYYTKLLEIDKENLGFIYYELGNLYLRKQDKINAINAFKLALSQDETNPFYHNSLAYSYIKAGLYEDAISHYNAAISINPDKQWTATVCHALGSVYANFYGNFEIASDKYKEGISLDNNNYDLRISLGDVYMANGNTDDAIRTYCEAIEINPDCYIAYSKVGLALWQNDMLNESVISYEKSIELNPNYDIAQNNLGVVYLDGLNEAEKALPLFEKAIELNPSYTLAYFNAGRSCEVLQDNIKAAEYYQMALDMNKLTEDLQDEEITTRLHSLFE